MRDGGGREAVCAVYSRKSRFTGKGESIENQIELCRRHIRLHWGEEEAGRALVYEDDTAILGLKSELQ